MKKDRVGRFYRPYMKEYVFVQLSADWLAEHLPGGLTAAVEVPLKEDDLKSLSEDRAVSPEEIGRNMLRVVGIDPTFPHTAAYLKFAVWLFGDDLADRLAKNADAAARQSLSDEAALSCRAALALQPDHPEAALCLAIVYRNRYTAASEPEEIGLFKAESIEAFERLSKNWPQLAEPWYYLVYNYLNLGLYRKAQRSWQEYLKLSDHPETRQEISRRLAELEEPVIIEDGVNQVLAGRYEAGLEILEPFVGGSYDGWWPLHYYLGLAFNQIGWQFRAIECFQKVLRLNPSHIDTMFELADAFAAVGDRVNEKKYRQKAELVQANISSEPMDPDA
jgi:tetratricopeptide (TPR) repeat protein